MLVTGKSGVVVLLTDFKTGTVVHPGNSKYKLGYFSDKWVLPETATQFTGKIILEN